MLVILFALGIIGFVALMEYLTGQRQTLARYFIWYLVIITSMYTAKAYCNFSYEENLEYTDPFKANDYDRLGWSNEGKFVPHGTPDNYINADGTLPKICLKKVQSTDKNIAWQSLILHREKGEKYFNEAKQICWYLPEISDREKARMAFTTMISAFPGPIHLKLVAATATLLAQYGLCCIDAFYDIDFNMNMSRYHFMLVDAFYNHIKNNGW